MKVLHLDDNPAWLEFLKPLFVAKRWSFKTCLQAKEAIEFLRSDKKGFDLLVADYNLPGSLSGVDVVLEAKKLGVDRVIMFSSEPDEAKKNMLKKKPDLAAEVLFFKKGNNFAIFAYLDSLR